METPRSRQLKVKTPAHPRRAPRKGTMYFARDAASRLTEHQLAYHGQKINQCRQYGVCQGQVAEISLELHGMELNLACEEIVEGKNAES